MSSTSISIICPIYNAEHYLSSCIESIISQTYQNFELILINDGSKDGSGKICDNYSQKDYRIKVIHKSNEGVSIARNIGLQLSKGEFIIFIDADDAFTSPYALEIIIKAEKYNHSDIIQYQETSKLPKNKNINIQSVKFETTTIDNFSLHHNYNTVWGFLFKSNIIKENKLSFTQGIKYGEDQEFISIYLLYCSQITIIKEKLYFYRITQGSAMGKGASIQNFDTFKRIIRYEQYYQLHKCNKNNLYSITINRWINNGFIYIKKYSFFNKDYAILNQQFKECYPIIRTIINDKILIKLAYIDIRIAIIYQTIKISLKTIFSKQ